MLGNASWNANRNSVRNLLGNASCFTDSLHFRNLTLDLVRNLTSSSFANHTSGANRNLLGLLLANHASDAVVFNASFRLTNNSGRAVVDGSCNWLANHSVYAVVNNSRLLLTNVRGRGARNLLGAWLADCAAYSVRNFFANLLTSVLGASNLLGGALRNPNLFADRTIWSFAANFGAASRNEGSAAGAGIGDPATASSVDLCVRSTWDNACLCFEVTATNRYRFHFGVRYADSAPNFSHLGFRYFATVVSCNRLHRCRGDRLANCVIDSPLLVFLDATTNVTRDFFRVVFLDAALDGVINRSLLLLSYRTLNCVVNGLVSCFANRSLNLVVFRAVLCFANCAAHWHLFGIPDRLVDRSVPSDLLLFINRSLHRFHNGIAASTSGCRGSCGNRVVACATTTLAPAEAG